MENIKSKIRIISVFSLVEFEGRINGICYISCKGE